MSRGRPRNFDKEEALAKAMELFWTQGYQRTGLTQLIEHMGIARQSLYLTFGDKRQLFFEALNHYSQTEIQFMKNVLNAPGSALDNINTFISMVKQRASDPNYTGCLCANSISEMASQDEEVSLILSKHMQEVEDELYNLFCRAKEENSINKNVSARGLARFTVTMLQGLSVLTKVRTEDFIDDVLQIYEGLIEK